MTKLDLTCDGRLQVSPFVNERKIGAMSEMISAGNSGGFAAARAAVQMQETLSSSDAVFSLAHLMNMRNLPEYDKAPRQWTKIASVEQVDDFEPVTFQRLVPNFGKNLVNGKGTKGKRVSPKVAELDTYQYTYGYSEESVQAAIEKRGFKWGISLEKLIGDVRREIRRIPGDMLEIALDTDEFLVFDRLQTGVTAASALKAGTNVDGTAVPANAAFSVAALRQLFSQISKRKDTLTGAAVPLAPKYHIVVALGQKEQVEDLIERERSIIQITDGTTIRNARPWGNLSKIDEVIESEFIDSETAWYLVPAAGSTKRTSLVKLELTGFTAPEVLVSNFAGIPVSGATGSPFDYAHFDNDSVDLKLRQFTNSALITQDQLGWSSGVN